MCELTAKEFRRLMETGQITVGKKGRLVEAELEPRYAQHLKDKGEVMVSGMNKRVRNATKVVADDGTVLADSKLEYKIKSHIESLNIPFEFQYVFVLTPKSRCHVTNKTIYQMTWKIDFVFPEYKLAVDAKGYVTEVAKLKYKFFRVAYPDWSVVFVKNTKEFDKLLPLIQQKPKI